MLYLLTQIGISLLLAAVLGGAVGWLVQRQRSRQQVASLRRSLSQMQQQVSQAHTDVAMIADDFNELKLQSQAEIDSLRQETQKLPALHSNLEKSQLLVRQLMQKHEAQLRELTDQNGAMQQQLRLFKDREATMTRLQAELAMERRRTQQLEGVAAAGALREQLGSDASASTVATTVGQPGDVAEPSYESLEESLAETVAEEPAKTLAERPAKTREEAAEAHSDDDSPDAAPDAATDAADIAASDVQNETGHAVHAQDAVTDAVMDYDADGASSAANDEASDEPAVTPTKGPLSAADARIAAELKADAEALAAELADESPLARGGRKPAQARNGSQSSGKTTSKPGTRTRDKSAARPGHAPSANDDDIQPLFEPVDQHDDLKRIFGIGPVTEKTLNKLGITSYSQLAELKQHDIDKIADALQIFPGRIERDNWVGSARRQLEEVLEQL